MSADDIESIIGGCSRITGLYTLMAHIKKAYIVTPRDELLMNSIAFLIASTFSNNSTHNPEGRMLSVVGAPGARKTRSIARALGKIANLENVLLCIKAPHPFTQKQLALAILSGLDYPMRRDPKENEAWDLARTQLIRNKTRFIWMDELHHALIFKGDADIKKVSESLKSLVMMPESPIGIIMSGLLKISEFVGDDAQLYHRSETVELEPLTLPEDISKIKLILNEIIVIRVQMKLGEFVDDAFLAKLCIAGDSQLGMIIDLTREAAFKAFQRSDFDGTVRLADFATVYARKRHCIPSQNIFTAENWTDIDPRNSRLRDIPDTPSTPTVSTAKGRKGRRKQC